MPDLRHLFMLDEQFTYLNHGAFGACPKPVFEVYQSWQRELEKQPSAFFMRRFGSIMKEARQSLGNYLGTDGENLVFVPNVTTAINMVAHSLLLEKGDEILTTSHEYGAMNRAWEFACARTGAIYRPCTIPLPLEDPESLVQHIWDQVSENTRVLFLSHITSISALRLPVEELLERARQENIITVIDGAHSPGQLDLNLSELKADFYGGNCHKWMLAPKGAGFLYAHPDVQELLDPLVVSWGEGSDSPSRFIQENEFQGVRDIAAYLSVAEAIRFMGEHNWDQVRQDCRDLITYARKELIRVTGRQPIAAPGFNQQMIAHPLPDGADAVAIEKALIEEHHIEVPIRSFDGLNLLRVSAQAYNNRAEIDRLIGVLSKLLGD